MDIAFNYPLKHNSLKLTEIMKDHRFFKITNFFVFCFLWYQRQKNEFVIVMADRIFLCNMAGFHYQSFHWSQQEFR